MKLFAVRTAFKGSVMERATSQKPVRPLWRRLVWMLVLWSASVLALGVVATLFRLLMTAAGLKTH
ncbi:hypothetical protein CTB91_01738 [Dickeya solani]|nr:hypothetical protein CTB91_01738 [Dickeya solani]ERO58536.1 hypothetical protein A544_1714 [Dickeya solani D s0432-1]AYQ51723.1 hypothetical protein DSOL99_01744 [Dickeya solani]MBD3605090.1 hypothetical protein [Dickeya solani]MBJ2329964.1 DUF2474 domain-containing protein [Dickeya solani]